MSAICQEQLKPINKNVKKESTKKKNPWPISTSLMSGIYETIITILAAILKIRYLFTIRSELIMVPQTLTTKTGFAPVTHHQRRAVMVVRASAQHQETSSRRSILLNTAVVASVLAPVQNAQAFLGLGEDASQKYTTETQAMIDGIRAALELAPNTDEREQAMNGVKKQTVAWVSAYRRDPKFAGRPSFSQMYSAVNALDGQLVSFGLKANFPAKRLDRMMKSIDDAERQLKRGR